MNLTGIWNVELAWYSTSFTHRCGLNGLVHSVSIWTICPCLIVKVLATRVKFLELTFYCPVINCTVTFRVRIVFGRFHDFKIQFKLVKIRSPIRLRCTFICVDFKSRTECINAQCVCTPTTVILPVTAGSSHGLNGFGHMISVPQTSTYKI